MKSIKLLILWAALGGVYLVMEGLWRGGWVHISMWVIGGLCGVAIGTINQIPRFYNIRIVWQSLIGAAIVLAIEFCAGCVLNLWWGLSIWDYSGQWGNVLGQICVPYALLWFAIMPFAIWAEDTGRWLLWVWDCEFKRVHERPLQQPYTLGSVYLDLIKGR